MYTHISVCIWLCKLFFCIFSHAFASPITHKHTHTYTYLYRSRFFLVLGDPARLSYFRFGG